MQRRFPLKQVGCQLKIIEYFSRIIFYLLITGSWAARLAPLISLDETKIV